MKRKLSPDRVQFDDDSSGVSVGGGGRKQFSRLQAIVRQQLKSASSRQGQGIASNAVPIVQDTDKGALRIGSHSASAAIMRPRADILKAINDEGCRSVANVYKKKETKKIEESIPFQNAASEIERNSGDIINPDQGDLPLYKYLRVGDVVLANIVSYGILKGEIVSVIHRGYTSAKYDVKLFNSNEVKTVPWTEMKRLDARNTNDHGRDDNVELKEFHVGKGASHLVGDSKNSKLQPPVDSFGRRIRDDCEVSAFKGSSAKTDDVIGEPEISARDFPIIQQETVPTPSKSTVSSDFVNISALKNKVGLWKLKGK